MLAHYFADKEDILASALQLSQERIALRWDEKKLGGLQSVAALRELVLAVAPRRRTRGRTATREWRVTEAGESEAWLSFETAAGRGLACVRFAGDRAFTLMTALEELSGHEDRHGRTRPKGVVHGVEPGRETWLEQLEREFAELGFERQPEVLIVGGGQGGIALAARLRQLDVPTVVADRHPRPGDAWRARYKSLCLHDPVASKRALPTSVEPSS